MGPEADFEKAPLAIPSRAIKETVDAEVVVVGAGISGLSAALSASEAGAKTVLIEKTASFNQRGLHNAALSSKLQKKAGIKVDRDQVINTIMEWGAYRPDQRVVTLWADNVDRCMDWLLDMAEAANIEAVLDPTTRPWYFPNYPTIHVFNPEWQKTLAEMLLSNGQAKGVDVHFNSPAVQLIRKGNGRVTGVIAKNPDGGYTRFNASKGVVLCTGDYGGDRQMVKKYLWPSVSRLKCEYLDTTLPPGQTINTGDGHKMGMQVGAAIDEPPHCPMLFDWGVWSGLFFFNLGRQPWLYVNTKGERFVNEDLPWGYISTQFMRQPNGFIWSIWDAKWEQEYPKLHCQCCKNMGPPTFLWHPKLLGEEVANGNVLEAQTIEELGKKMGVPLKTFKATVARYTALARKGKDLDFGKHPDRLTTLEKPPFYACQQEARYLVILGGLQVNTDLNVLDNEGNAIPGLYAAGNVSGSFFGSQYPTTVPGLTHSRAFTFGRLAALNAAAEKV
jgi:fumarate reductase flavoprotein subunit